MLCLGIGEIAQIHTFYILIILIALVIEYLLYCVYLYIQPVYRNESVDIMSPLQYF